MYDAFINRIVNLREAITANFYILRRIIPIIWRVSPYRLIFMITINLTQGLIPIAQIWVTQKLVDSVANIINDSSASLHSAYFFLLLEIALILLSDIIHGVREYIMFQVQQATTFHIDELIAKKASSIPLIYFETSQYYDQLQRVSQGMAYRGLTVISTFMNLIQNLFTLVWFTIYLINFNFLFAVLITVLLIPPLMINLRIGKNLYIQMMRQTATERKAHYIMSLITGRSAAKELRLFNLASFFRGMWSRLFWKNANERSLLTKQSEIKKFIAQLFVTSTSLIGISSIIWMCHIGKLTLGYYVSISQAFLKIQTMMQETATTLSLLYEESLFLKELFLFLDLPEESNQTDSEAFPFKFTDRIQVRNLGFAYPNSHKNQLKNICFEVKKGHVIAIVGENGAGKSTLAKCLIGLYKPTSGTILFDQIPIEDIDSQQLRANISAIFQDFVQYQLTVRENIGIGNPHHIQDGEKIRESAMKAGVSSVIDSLPNHLETELGPVFEGGKELSMGQWQKIALSRAYFKDAPIILLDEPTASIDPVSEANIYDGFMKLAKGKTAFIISHRLASCQIADHILVLHNGEIIEEGNHNELILKNGKYAEMFRMQAKWYNEKPSLKEDQLSC